MKKYGTPKRRLLIFLFIIITISTITSIQSKRSDDSASVELAIFNFSYSWGYCNVNDGHSDFYSPWKFTMGLANNGTTKLSLEEVNVTFVEKAEGCITRYSKTVISEKEGLPVTLYPRYYWLYNITCPYRSTIGVKIQITTDSMVIDYDEVISYNRIRDIHEVWLNWSTYRFYTERTNLSPMNFGGLVTGLVTLILLRKKRKARRRLT